MKLCSVCATLLSVLFASSLYGQAMNDQMGFLWDIQQNGTISDGSSDTYDGAYILYVNSNIFNGGQMSQEKGMNVYGPQDIGGITVTRHIALVTDPVGIVYVDSYKNSGGQAVNVSPMHNSDMGETGNASHRENKKGETIASVYVQNNGRSSVTIMFGDKSTTYLPKMMVNGDDQTVNYPQFKLPAGQERSIAYFVAQRATGTGPELRDDEKAFSKAVRQVAKKKKFNFLNVSGLDLFSLGDIELIPQGEADYLETRSGDKVYGNLVTDQFTLETALGVRKLPVTSIVNIIGSKNGRTFQVVTNDGGALTGKLTPESIEFGLADGGSGEISLLDISRLVPKLSKVIDPKNKAKWFKFSQPVFVYKNGDRIAGELLSSELEIHLSVGEMLIPLANLKTIELTRNDDGSDRGEFLTADGQQFSGMFYKEIEVRVWDDKVIKIPPTDLKSIYLEAGNDTETGDVPTDKPILKLGDDEFLVATIKAEKQPLEFKTAFGVRTMDPAQISQLRYVPGLAGEMQIVLWDGSTLTGKLTAEHVVFEILGTDMKLLPSMIGDYSNPNALPPESMRQKYIELIDQLGSPKFKEREAAFERLERDADKIRGLLESRFEGADAETKSRLAKLLGRKIEKSKKKKGKKKAEETDDEPPAPMEQEAAVEEAAVEEGAVEEAVGEEAVGEEEADGEADGEEAAEEAVGPGGVFTPQMVVRNFDKFACPLFVE